MAGKVFARLHAVRSPALLPTARAERLELQPSDEELVERLARGDRWAQEALYRRYVRVVWGTAIRLLGSSAEAEDLVQDTFAEALRDLARLRKIDALRPWLLGIAVHQAQRRFRRRALLRRLGLEQSADDATLASLVDPGAPPETHSELAQVDRALRRLSSDERFAWILRYVEGSSLEEVAALCRCSLATAKRRLARANGCVVAHLQGGEAKRHG
jgi:RNA polymerase sigma-70 factor, ECF subfamily